MMPGNDLQKHIEKSALPLDLHLDLPGITMVIAPHPDDESLGCGGTIALLKDLGRQVFILFVSDGSMSHPNSKMFPKATRIALRKREALEAAAVLGIVENACIFAMLPDGSVPCRNDEQFQEAVTLVKGILNKVCPVNIILPWKNDPHKDHRASWQIVQAAVSAAGMNVRFLHYMIWFWERGDTADPDLASVSWHAVDISAAYAQKKLAIAAHVSQVTRLIDDDETGFILSQEVLAHFMSNRELFAIIETST